MRARACAARHGGVRSQPVVAGDVPIAVVGRGRTYNTTRRGARSLSTSAVHRPPPRRTDGGRQLAKEKHYCVPAVSQHDVIWHAMMRVMGACRRAPLAARRLPAACPRLPGLPVPGAYFSQSSDDKSIHILSLLLTIVSNLAFQRFQCNYCVIW